MAETKLRKKPEEISEKAAIEYLSKVGKQTYKTQKNQDEATKESLLTLRKSLLILEKSLLERQELNLKLKEILLEQQEVFRQISENLVEDFSKDLENDNAILQVSSNQYLQNYEALRDLQKKQSKLHNILMIAAGASALGFSWNPLVAMAEATGSWFATELSIPIDRTVSIMEMLLEEFKEDGITITPQVKTEEGTIDLFIRTADGRYFAFMLRSNGDSKVKWREDRQGFFVLKKGCTAKWSEVYSIGDRLNNAARYLKEQKNPLLGNSNTERRKQVVKGIILTGKTRIDPNNDPALLVDFGRTKALRVKTEATFYLVDKANVVDFLRKPAGTS
jgi:hypothetical protein